MPHFRYKISFSATLHWQQDRQMFLRWTFLWGLVKTSVFLPNSLEGRKTARLGQSQTSSKVLSQIVIEYLTSVLRKNQIHWKNGT